MKHKIFSLKGWLMIVATLALTALSFARPAFAQQPTGSIEGTVTDPSGAVINGATITARDVTTNQTRSTTTRSDGKYLIQQLTPGVYELKVAAQGFKSTVISNVKVDVGKTTAADVKTELGGANEQVTIVGGETQIDRVDHTVSGVVNALQVNNLPLNGRNFLDLARLQPGTETVDGANFDPTKANYTGVSIAGQMGRSTQITVDGGSVVDNVVGTTVQNFSQEIVQEFQVGISNFDLSTGASATGSVNVVSKSGSNEYHGNGYIYWRDSRFSAFPSLKRLVAAEGIPKAAQANEIPFDREQFGGTFSGPLKKDKVFFFTNYEYNNQDAVAIHALSPTVASFSGFTGNPFNETLATGKLDWTISDKFTLSGRYSHNHNDQQAPFPLASGIVPRQSTSGIFQSEDQLNINRSDGFVVNLTTIFRPTLTNTLIYGLNDFHNRIDPVTKNVPSIRVFNNGNQDWRSGTNYITPQVTDQNRNQIRDDLAWTKTKHNIRVGGDYERTSIGGLFDFAKPSRIIIYGPATLGSSTPLLTEADFLNSPVRTLAMGIGTGVLPFNTPGGATVNHRFQFYATDSWKLTNRFTLNYGLAYRLDTNLWNHDQPKPASIAPLFTKGTAAAQRDNNNLAPRLGFAYDVRGDGRTVIRGGFGMYYDTTIDNLRLFERADLGKAGSELFLASTDIQSALLPGGDGLFGSSPTSASGFITLRDMLALAPAVRKDLESSSFTCTKPTSIECLGAVSGPLFSSTFQVPYSLQYAIGVQREFPGKIVFQADFNYRKGVHEVLVYDANFHDSVDKNGTPTPVLPRSRFDNTVSYADSSAFSVYKALLMRVDRRFSGGFQLTGSYAFSRLNNFGGDALGLGSVLSDRNNFRGEFGPGGLDRTHRLVISGLYELPFFKNSSNKFTKQALGGWQVSLISTAFSGLPFSAILPDFADLTGTGSFFSYLPGVGPGQVGRKFNSLPALNSAIRNYNQNRSKFAAFVDGGVPFDPFGTELRELAELPPGTYIGSDSILSQDVRLTKRFRFSEKKSLDFITEVFNLFNVANLTNFADNVIPARDDVSDPSQFTVFRPTQRANNIFGTGGPRSFQFALKFTY